MSRARRVTGIEITGAFYGSDPINDRDVTKEITSNHLKLGSSALVLDKSPVQFFAKASKPVPGMYLEIFYIDSNGRAYKQKFAGTDKYVILDPAKSSEVVN